jgi:hypothetical protein
MARIDLPATIERIDFPGEVWAWLDLLGDVVVGTQKEAISHETFMADNLYKQLLVRSVNRDLTTLNAIYILLRYEFIHQAAAHVRLFCEALITVSYIARDPTVRVPLFLDYATIDEYKVASTLLAWERETAKPGPVAALEERQREIQIKYDQLLPKYNRGRLRNWCNATVKTQAKDCGHEKLYEIVYGQMSAYVHGSAWSLRRQMAYSRKHYDKNGVRVDIATIVRTTVAVWIEWAKFADRELGWSLTTKAGPIAVRCEALDTEQFEGKY